MVRLAHMLKEADVQSRIIFLHGASSSGKSTIARPLQEALDTPFLYFSIDHFREAGMLPLAGIRSGKFQWSAMRKSFFDGFHRSLAAFASSGNDLIVEHIVETREWMFSLLTLLAPFDVFFVAVDCPLPELERREAARGDRPTGDARRDFMSIDLNAIYDLELNRTAAPEDNVRTLIAAWRGRMRPSAFESMALQ